MSEENRMARLGSPLIAIPWAILGTAKPTTLPVGFGTWTTKRSRSLPSTARTLAARFAGSLNRAYSCARAMVVPTIRTDRGLLDRRSADCSSTATRSRTENFLSRLAKCRHRVSQSQIRSKEKRHAPDPKSRRVVRSAPAAGHDYSRNCHTSSSSPDRKLVLCVRQRCAHVLHAADCHRHTACANLRAFRWRGVGQPSDPESWRFSWLGYSGPARLGLEFHGRDRPDSHGASFSRRGLQVSQRTHLDRWCSSSTRHPRHGVYRASIAI